MIYTMLGIVDSQALVDSLVLRRAPAGTYYSRALISATGTLRAPIIPKVEGRDSFKGVQLHSSEYRNPEAFRGKKVMVVGEGNSGAQILAELSRVTTTRRATRKEPEFLPAEVDGRALFDRATAQYYAQREGKQLDPETGVRWNDGSWEEIDAIVWCTGFGSATEHLSGLVETDEVGKTATNGTRSTQEPGLWRIELRGARLGGLPFRAAAGGKAGPLYDGEPEGLPPRH